jgi:NCS1 family nucleobase:cation symporter-1
MMQEQGPTMETTSNLGNEDLLPSPPGERDWVWEHFTFLWLGMVICIPAYLLAGGLMEQGLSPLAAIGAILLGNVIILVPMALIGHAGARYGIPFAVLARASFGTGAPRSPRFRARSSPVAGTGSRHGWGKHASRSGGGSDWGPCTARPCPSSAFPGSSLAFLLFWALQLFVVTKGMRRAAVRDMDRAGQGRLADRPVRLGHRPPGRDERGLFADRPCRGSSSAAQFFPAVTAMVGFWATLSLNIPDFTRFARSQRDQMVGQALGLPIPMALLGLVSIVTGFATMTVYGVAIHDPLVLADRMTGWPVLLGLLVISIDTVSCNIAANLVGPAYDFSAIWPGMSAIEAAR